MPHHAPTRQRLADGSEPALDISSVDPINRTQRGQPEIFGATKGAGDPGFSGHAAKRVPTSSEPHGDSGELRQGQLLRDRI